MYVVQHGEKINPNIAQSISYLLFCQTCCFSFERLLKLSFKGSSSSVAADLSLHPRGVQKNCQ